MYKKNKREINLALDYLTSDIIALCSSNTQSLECVMPLSL